MQIFSYIITRDFGFAPNPFPPYCTLATCKPRIRQTAREGDWVIGLASGARKSDLKSHVIYIMRVEEKLTFNEYWKDTRFIYKSPVMNGSKRQKYGDRVYHSIEDGVYIQEDSHHSLPGGIQNEKNYNRDLSSKFVLVSKEYWYFGKNAPLLPCHLDSVASVGRNHIVIKDETVANGLLDWVHSFPELGYLGEPMNFSSGFQRYPGE